MNENALRLHALQVGEAIAALIEAMGMMAENQVRVSRGEAMAYDESAFQDLINQRDLGYNDLINKSREYF